MVCRSLLFLHVSSMLFSPVILEYTYHVLNLRRRSAMTRRLARTCNKSNLGPPFSNRSQLKERKLQIGKLLFQIHEIFLLNSTSFAID